MWRIRLILEISYVKADHIAKRPHWFLKNAAIEESVMHACSELYIHVGNSVWTYGNFHSNVLEFQSKWTGKRACMYSHSTLWEFTFKCDGNSTQTRVNYHPESNVCFVNHHPGLVSVIVCRGDGRGVAVTWTADVLDDHTLTLDTRDRVRGPSEESLTEERVGKHQKDEYTVVDFWNAAQIQLVTYDGLQFHLQLK
jgi:hypothetical protein